MGIIRDNETTIVERSNKNFGFGYTNYFKQILRNHPGIVKSAVSLVEQAEKAYHPADMPWGEDNTLRWNPRGMWELVVLDGRDMTEAPLPLHHLKAGRGVIFVPGESIRDSATGLEVSILGKSNREFKWGIGNLYDRTTYLKVTLEDNAFFVKKSTSTLNPGFSEFRNTQQIKKALEEVEEVDVVDAQFGYLDRKQSWFVSKWVELSEYSNIDALANSSYDDYGNLISDDQFFLYHDKFAPKVADILDKVTKAALKSGIILADTDMNSFFNQRPIN